MRKSDRARDWKKQGKALETEAVRTPKDRRRNPSVCREQRSTPSVAKPLGSTQGEKEPMG